MNRAERICGLLSVAAGGVVFTTIHKFFPEEEGRQTPDALHVHHRARAGGDRSQLRGRSDKLDGGWPYV